jgi:hypothetical protein
MGLGTLDLIMTVEKEFGIRIPDADADRLMKVGALIDYIMEKTGYLAREPVAQRIQYLTWQHAGSRTIAPSPEQITEEMSFYNDLDY